MQRQVKAAGAVEPSSTRPAVDRKSVESEADQRRVGSGVVCLSVHAAIPKGIAVVVVVLPLSTPAEHTHASDENGVAMGGVVGGPGASRLPSSMKSCSGVSLTFPEWALQRSSSQLSHAYIPRLL